MDFVIANQRRTFIPIAIFRQRHGLSSQFGVALFAPKDFTGRGHMPSDPAPLRALHQTVVRAVPASAPRSGWMAVTLELQMLFHRRFLAVNGAIGLSRSEIEYATAGLADVTQRYLTMLLMNAAPLPFEDLYAQWLNQTIEPSRATYSYEHHGETWSVRLLRHVYGRFGLIVEQPMRTDYVYDAALLCPAERFMHDLLRDVCARMRWAIRQDQETAAASGQD